METKIEINLSWWIPETIPWFYANGRLKEAETVFKKIADYNKLSLTEEDLKIFTSQLISTNLEHEVFLDTDSKVNNEIPKLKSVNYSITMLIRNRYLRRHMSLALVLL